MFVGVNVFVGVRVGVAPVGVTVDVWVAVLVAVRIAVGVDGCVRVAVRGGRLETQRWASKSHTQPAKKELCAFSVWHWSWVRLSQRVTRPDVLPPRVTNRQQPFAP